MTAAIAQTSAPGMLLTLLLVALNLRPAVAAVGPLLETLRTDLHLSHGEAGLLTTLPVICMGLFAPLAMPLSARLGSKQTALGALLLLGFATSLRAQGGWISLLFSSLLIGTAIAVLGTLLGTYIKLDFPQRSARISSWTTTALCLSAALAAGSSATLGDFLGWPGALGSWALPAFIAAWQWQRVVPDRPRLHAAPSHALPWRQPRAWQLMITFGLQSLVFYGLLAWLAPAYLSFGLTTVQAGRLLALFTFMQIAGTLLVSALPARQRERRPALILGSISTLSGLSGVWLAPLAAPFAWMCLLGAGTASLFAVNLVLSLDYSDSPDAAAGWIAMMCGGGYLIAAVGPYLCGVLRDVTGGYAGVFAMLFVCGAAGLLLSLLLGPGNAAAD